MKEKFNVKKMTTIAILTTISVIISFFDIPVPFVATFMKLDLSNIFAIIGGFYLGIFEGVCIVFLRILIRSILKGSNSMYIGELSSFIISTTFVFVSSYIYRNKGSKKIYKSLFFGAIAMVAVAFISNYYFIFPAYSKVLGINLEKIILQAKAVNFLVKDYNSMMFYMVLPFNIFKGIIEFFIVALLYKKLSGVFE